MLEVLWEVRDEKEGSVGGGRCDERASREGVGVGGKSADLVGEGEVGGRGKDWVEEVREWVEEMVRVGNWVGEVEKCVVEVGAGGGGVGVRGGCGGVGGGGVGVSGEGLGVGWEGGGRRGPDLLSSVSDDPKIHSGTL